MTSPAMWEVHLHKEKHLVTLRILLLVQRRAMARWKASDVYLSNLTSKKFCHPDLAITGVEVTSQPGLSYTTIPDLAVS